MDLPPTSRPDHRESDHSFHFPAHSTDDIPGWSSDSWVDPHEERLLLRRRLRRYNLGFSLLGLALAVASLSMMGNLILSFRRMGPLGALLGIPHWNLIEQSLIVWPSLLGVLLLTGSWPDKSWQRRSVLLLLMCLVDALVFCLDNAVHLGLADGKIPHEWLRQAITTTIGWSEFALIASLAADMAAHLGEPQAIDFGRAVRSLATTGAMVWFVFFYFVTDWHTPIWPLRQRPFNHMTIMLYLSWVVLGSINFVQTTVLSFLAGRCCGRALREMARQDQAHEQLPPSRSEDGWAELNQLSGPK